MTIKKLIQTLGAAAALTAITVSAAKPIPAGIIRLIEVSQARLGNVPAWTNSNIDGVRARLDWPQVQPVETSRDWSDIDEVLKLGSQYGKLVGLSVAAGCDTPQWVYDSGASKYALRDGTGRSMSLPWDAVFQTKWLAFVRAMGARYDGNPALGYIVMAGMGQGNETFLAQTAADINALTALGGPSAWVTAAKKIVATYADAFPTTPFFITAAKPFGNAAPLQEVIDWGVATYPGRFGIMNAGLNATSNVGYYPNLAIYTYRARQPVGFQAIWSYFQDGGSRLGGTIDQTLTAGVQLGAEFVEVYPVDADDPAQQTVFTRQGAALKANVPPSTPTGLRILP